MAGSVRVDGLGLVTAIVPDGPAFVYATYLTRIGNKIAESTARYGVTGIPYPRPAPPEVRLSECAVHNCETKLTECHQVKLGTAREMLSYQLVPRPR